MNNLMEEEYAARLGNIEKEIDSCLSGGNGTDEAWLSDVFARVERAEEAGVESALPASEAARFVAEPARDLLSRGGKRWRPLLAVLVAECLGGKKAAATATALSPLVELCHNASLIHDDIEDKSAVRRGKAAIHEMFGEDTAINSGAFLYFLPLMCIERLAASAEWKAALYRNWAEYMRRLHLGQSLDIRWHRDRDYFPDEHDYLVMCRLKTGCLARFAVKIGIIAAEIEGAPVSSVRNARQLLSAAEQLGLGFQILDDVNNLGGGIAGKIAGDDLVEGKKSLPVLYYITQAPLWEKEARRRLVQNAFFAASRAKSPAVDECRVLLAALAESGALESARAKSRFFLDQGRALLGAFPSAEREAKRLLEHFPALLG